MRAHRIGLIPGDGIGPAITAAAVTVLDAAVQDRARLDWHRIDAGADTFRRTGSALSPADLARIRGEFAATLKGPVGLPEVRHPDGTEAGVLGGILRTGLDAYANVRPVATTPGIPGALAGSPRIDYVIVRENTEGLYASRGRGVGNEHAHVDQLLVTRAGTERIVRRAFEIAVGRSGAPADGVRRVTCVDKANVLPSLAFFRRVFDEVAAEFRLSHPDIVAEHRYVDACAAELITNPGRYDVLVTENLLGDILSDIGAATVGGLGTCPSGNLGDGAAYFEPVHGSAPDLAASAAGPDAANPSAQIRSGAMLLDHLGERAAADRVRAAVDAVARNTVGTFGGCSAFAHAVVSALGNTSHAGTRIPD